MRNILRLVVLFLVLPLGAMADQNVDRTVAATASGVVEIDNIAGSITVEGWNGGEIRITGTLGDDVEALEVNSEGDRTRIRVKLPEGRHSGNKDFQADLTIQVPRDSSIEARLVSASAAIRGVFGEVDVETVSGAVKASGDPRKLEVQTVSGDITAQVQTDEVEVETVSGEVELGGSFRVVAIQAVSSNLQLELGSIERASLQNVSGDLIVSADPSSGGRLEIQAHSGDVKLTLPAGIAANFQINTFSGDIHNGFGPPAKRTSKYAPGKSLDFSTGDRATIEVQGFSGDVHLIKG